jgi:hypothetical protein
MKILLASMELTSLTGQPMYTYHLAKGLRELGHEIVCAGLHADGEVKEMFQKLGCKVVTLRNPKCKGKFDLALIAENIPEYLEGLECDKIYNISHSKSDCDKPIDDERITGYIAPRTQVSEYWEEQFDIKFEILPIPIDFKKWELEHIPQERYTILAPCGMCEIRKKMLLDLINRARKDGKIQVWIMGEDYGALKGVEIPDNVKVMTRTFEIEQSMRRADEVAGIFIGTVTLEAWAMGVETSVYDEEGNWDYVEKPKDFNKHDYKKVTERFLEITK